MIFRITVFLGAWMCPGKCTNRGGVALGLPVSVCARKLRTSRVKGRPGTLAGLGTEHTSPCPVCQRRPPPRPEQGWLSHLWFLGRRGNPSLLGSQRWRHTAPRCEPSSEDSSVYTCHVSALIGDTASPKVTPLCGVACVWQP